MNAVACLDIHETEWADAAEQTSQVRIEKVLAVREQLAEGSYSVAKRLDAALDRLLEDLLEQ